MPSVNVKATIVGSSVVFSDVDPTDNGVEVNPQNTSHLLVEPNEEEYEITIELQGGAEFQDPAITLHTSPQDILLPRDSANPSLCMVPNANHLTPEQSAHPISFSMHTTSFGQLDIEDPTIVNNPPPP